MKFIRYALIASLMVVIPAVAFADSQWVLEHSTLVYHVSHPLHHVDGASTAARGRGACKDGTCNFLAAVPVKSFDSGDTNRDLHMLEITRGAKFPLVIVRTEFAQADLKTGTLKVNLTVQFAGQTAHFDQIPFHMVVTGNEFQVVGTIPAKVSDFKIPPPELLAMPIKDDIPISVDMTWRGM
jgi:hypothetical protein